MRMPGAVTLLYQASAVQLFDETLSSMVERLQSINARHSYSVCSVSLSDLLMALNSLRIGYNMVYS